MRKKVLGLFAFLGLAASMLIGCGPKKVDYVSQCQLESTIKYTDTTFLDGGIGEVELKATVDGDTAHFYQKEVNQGMTSSSGKGRVVKVRFYGIDTPESTGKIEPYGKAASKFTSEKLLAAKTIVLSVDTNKIGSPAAFDSTGTRYVGFVWISEKANCPQEELKLLNLWVVQEGYSNAKSITESPLAQFFLDADMQAQKLKLGQWKGPKYDPFPPKEDINETDIKTIMDSFADEGEASPWCNAKVGVTGTVYKVVGTDCYLNTWIDDPITHEHQQYGLFVFAGYKNYAPLKQKGAVIHVVGTFQIHYGNPQLTNVAYDSLHPSASNMSVVTPATEGSIDIPTVKAADVADNPLALNRVVELKGLTATGGYDEQDATTLVKSGAFSVYATDDSGASITFRVTKDVWVVDSNNVRVETYAYFMEAGLTFDVIGAIALFESQSGKITYQITLCNKMDVTVHHAG